jgi:hypothetical protein
MLFNNSVRTSKRTPQFTVTKINWLMLFAEIMAVCSENHARPINTKCTLLIVKTGGTYSYHWGLKD